MTKKMVESAELRISKLLRYGVLLAGFCIAIGFIGSIFIKTEGQSTWQQLTTYEAVPLSVRLNQLIVSQQWGQLICYLGLFILISLPILRVLLTGFLFIRSKEFMLAAMAFFVFFVLLLGFMMGLEVA